MRKSINLSIFYFLFIFILIYIFFSQVFRGYQKDSWQITEFLINYQGGFVRRGLLGEILLTLYNLFGANPYKTILFLCASAYLVLAVFFIKSFLKHGYPIFILPFVFFLGNPIINDFWVRKDVLISLIFISTIYFSTKKSGLYLILVNLFFIMGLLIHESIGFFGFPILFLMLLNKNKIENTSIKSISISLFQLLPSVITFLSVLYYKGSQTVADLIWNSWKPVVFPLPAKDDSQIPQAIDMLSWSLKQGLLITADILKNFNDGIYAPIAWLLIILLIYYLLTNTDKLNVKILNYEPKNNFNKTTISNTLILQLFSVIPLFILGCDYGRWIFLWVTSSFAVIILIPDKISSDMFPQFVSAISTKLNIILDSILSNSKGFMFLLCLIIGFPQYGWNLILSVYSSAIIIVLDFISRIIFLLGKLFF
ncbi:MAG: hypothetical protein NTW65_05335 [Deltaproteobacteria bacterium]|nr:hypothetical protein [Deltaproteobacteria bacterium]